MLVKTASGMARIEPSAKETKEQTMDIPIPAVPVTRDEMDDAAFNAMMARGLSEAKADQSRAVSDAFAELRREMQEKS